MARLRGSDIVDETITGSDLQDGSVNNADLANMAQATIKGRASGAGTGAPTDLTSAQATAILDTFTSGAKGLVPASGGGTTNFLRADGSFAAPPDTTGITQLTGDVTAGPGSGSQAATIANDSVSNAKLANVPTATFKGRETAGTGDPEDLTISQAKNLLSLSGTNSGDQTITLTGDVTGSGTGSFAATIANDAVTFAKMQNIATDRLVGRDTAGSGDPEEISVSGGLEFSGAGAIQRSALTGDVTASAGSNSTTIANDAVTNAKLANVATSTFKGRVTAGTGDPEDLTGTQATTLLDVFTSGLKGLVPASGGGTTNFLRADGTFAAPGGGGSGKFELLATASPSAATSASFTSVITSAYDYYKVVFRGLTNTTNPNLLMFISNDNGSTWTAELRGQRWDITVNAATAPTYSSIASSTTGIIISSNGGGAWHGWIDFISSSVTSPRVIGESMMTYTAGVPMQKCWFQNTQNNYINAIRFEPASGTFTGSIYLYGAKNT